jgi:transglutaminase-like putative cysteine protease
MAPGVGDTDIGLTQSIKLNRRLPRPHETDSVVFRISLPKDEDPGTAFARDARQEVKNAKGTTFELHIKAVREPQSTGDPDKKIGDEFLKSNFFLNSADAKVQEHARRAVGKETDPWKKAQLVEKWVHNNMKVLNFTEAMATADHVARTLEGDCSEFSMLAAAMCRAVGVPSRIAIGLVYAEMPRGPMLAYHMWTEVWVRGQWVTIDATLGRGSIGAAHLKITDHSWHDVQTLTPLLPVMRVMLGEPKIEIIRINGVE